MTRVGIVGLGPVGSILAAHLSEGGAEVVVEDVARDLVARIQEEGITVTGASTASSQVSNAVYSLAELAKFEPEIIFIAVKACFLKNVLTELGPLYTSNMKIVSFQNGLDNECVIAEALGIETVYRIVINYAGSLISPGNVRTNWFQPPNYIGVFKKGHYGTDDTTDQIAGLMTKCGLDTEPVPDIKLHIWEKSILNSALCSVCALTRQTMKAAMEYEPSRTLAVKIIEEGLLVAKSDGYGFSDDALQKFTRYLEKGGAHKPSMLMDVENGRRTEVDFLSGAIVAYGKKHGIATPVNDILTRLLKSLENTYAGSD